MKALPDIYQNKDIGYGLMIFGITAFAFFIFCAWFIYIHRADNYRAYALILAAIWIVGSPTWFFIEHFYFFKNYGDPTQYEQFKRGQELAAKIWAGGILVLAAIWSNTIPGACS